MTRAAVNGEAGPTPPSATGESVTPAPQFREASGDGYRCPFCQARGPVVAKTRISRNGWIVFALLFLIVFPFCWIGLLMTESYQVCGNCGRRV